MHKIPEKAMQPSFHFNFSFPFHYGHFFKQTTIEAVSLHLAGYHFEQQSTCSNACKIDVLCLASAL